MLATGRSKAELEALADARPGRIVAASCDMRDMAAVEALPQRALDAFGRLAREHATVRLVIAGSAGNDVAAVDRAIARLSPDVAERVVRTGIVDDAAKRWLLTNARALAYPSLDEGFGFPVLEAQQAGTPVVASTAGSIPQIAGAAALLSPARDVAALAANLDWIVSNDEMHAKLVRRGHANVARFSWAATAERYHQMYEDVAANV